MIPWCVVDSNVCTMINSVDYQLSHYYHMLNHPSIRPDSDGHIFIPYLRISYVLVSSSATSFEVSCDLLFMCIKCDFYSHLLEYNIHKIGSHLTLEWVYVSVSVMRVV